jgi:hypothetical protein
MTFTKQPIPKWGDFTREERFFTAELYINLRRDKGPFWSLLGSKLESSANIVDIGYEVCFFRDFHHGLLQQSLAYPVFTTNQVPSLKQTFDLVLTLSNNRLVLIEAKAQQGFSTAQLDELKQARQHLTELTDVEDVYLVGLHSSKYRLRSETMATFNANITWAEIVGCYPESAAVYSRADSLYRH